MAGRTDPPIDREIDRLYQLPLAEFTRARDALAKTAGDAGAAIRKLQKPNAAAWAVNQLYWRRRADYDRLVASAARRRTAHGKMLSGKGGDVAAAESAHRGALKAAADAIRALLKDAAGGNDAGGRFSAALGTENRPPASFPWTAVTETLEALPGPAATPPGRLTRPLRPAGLEALAGLVPGSGGATLRALTVVRPAPPAPPAADTAAAKRAAAVAAKREAAARAKEAAALAKREAAARAALAKARQALARADREHTRLQDQLQFAAKRVQDLRAEVSRLERGK